MSEQQKIYKKMSKFGRNPLTLLKIFENSNRDILVNDAIAFFSNEFRSDLVALMASDDLLVRTDGYFIFANLGENSRDVLDDAIKYIRTNMNHYEVLDAMFSYPKRLDAAHVNFVKSSLNNEEEYVRNHAEKLLGEM